MMDELFGRKLGMTQAFDQEGNVVALTAIKLGPCVVIQKKTDANDGYCALQVGFEEDKTKKINLPVRGHLARSRRGPFRVIKEVRVASGDVESYKEGQEIKVSDIFSEGQFVDVAGTSKGRGFAGTVKRWKFKRGPEAHGSKNVRNPGSIGMHTWPARVLRGKRMGGHMGNERVTVQNLKVFRIDASENLLFVIGAISGARNSFVMVKHSKKKKAKAEAKAKAGAA